MDFIRTVSQWAFGRSFSAKLFWGIQLVLLLILTRWAWIDCDGGVPSVNEYGYFATDEGFYCGGGKMKFLRGKFVSVIRASPCTYGICPSTHLMTYISFTLFGQTTWAHRVFPMLLCSLAWLLLFAFFTRRIFPWLAFVLIAVCVLNPFLVAYGRTACNDTIMGSLLIIGYVLTRKRGCRPACMGGVIFGLGLWVKMSIWVLFPLGLSAAAMSYRRDLRLKRMGLFLAGFALSACLQFFLIRFMVQEDAANQGVTVSELLKISNTSYPLPNVFDLNLWLRALSSFPRCPSDGVLGLWIALFLVLPSLLLLRRLSERPFLWDGRLLLYAIPPLYSIGIMLLPVYYSHYFIPIIMFTPIIWLEAHHDIRRWAGGKPTVNLLLLSLSLAAILIPYHLFRITPDRVSQLQNYISNAYNLPASCTWTWNGVYILCATGLLVAFILLARQRKPTGWIIAGIVLSALLAAHFCFMTIPLCEAHKYTQIFTGRIRKIAFSLQVSCVLLLFAVWGLPSFLKRRKRWYLLFPTLLLLGLLTNQAWFSATRELTERRTLHKEAAKILKQILPDNAVVFGERAPQVLLSLKQRVTGLPNSDPVPYLYAVNDKYPHFHLYALLDSEHNYHFNHYDKHKERIRMEVVHTLTLPSFNTTLPCNVFLVRLHLLDRQHHGRSHHR